ncbi:conserved hypothetical protein [Histoplasma capsulatum var. duboisii H88]|uniref:Uncharacterized protein n=2 Tax=Ajellomyces capsulatus TaxID=5037 RepID=F0U905_AJEC8|nr:conserved hypothetical protein [Histoplasma capsulatum H143]EGC41007.1 conserved hypothetical protein [Histoplasma capsulatum var. duboisii H88]QSS52557.1 hypothetical protein I7I53_08240 [Histoplasma capsulatum var. duboisii H88]
MRFTAASVALFAGSALASYQNGYPVEPYPEPTTVYSTKDVTITSCPPGVYNCPGNQPQPTGYPVSDYPVSSDYPVTSDEPLPTGYPTGEPEPTDTGYPTETPSASPTGDEYPTGGYPTGAYPTETESSAYPTEVEPTGGEYPTGANPTDSYPTGGESSVYPTGAQPTTSTITYTTCIPTVTSSTTVIYPTENTVPTYSAGSEGLPQPTGGYPTNPTPPPYEGGAASSVGTNFAVAGLAAVAALFLA